MTETYSRDFSAVKKKAVLQARQFLQSKRQKKRSRKTNRDVIKAAKEVSVQTLILLAVISVIILYVVIIAGCLCYVGRHGRRTC
jgi:Flp pilus assembly protein TadB